MERTKKPNKEIKTMTDQQVRTLVSLLTTRANLSAVMGMQYSGARDLYKALGYPTDTELNFARFAAQYKRQDIAKAIINRPVKATWQGSLELIESHEGEDTPFEKEWMGLEKKFGLKTRFAQVDKLTGIGRYGVLLLGLDDVKDIAGFSQSVKPGKRKLMYLKAYSEATAKIQKFEEDTKNPRYGLPVLYEMTLTDMGDLKSSVTVQVHYSRVIHIVDDPLESEVYGTPRLEAVFNRLMDLEKIIGGSGEMFWRGGRPGYSAKADKDFAITSETKQDLLDQIDEYENDLRRILALEGMDLKSLEQQISSPDKHVDVNLQMISAETGIPKRVLTGTERGELASQQDSEEWKDYVQARRNDHAEPHIVRPVVDRFIALGILPEPGEDYTVKWSDLYAQSEKARVEIGKARATALREYTYSPISQLLLPPDPFMEFCLGFSTEQITLVRKMRSNEISEEELNAAILEKALKDEKEGSNKNETETE